MSTAAVAQYCERHPEDEVYLLGLPGTLSVFQNAPQHYRFINYDRNGEHKSFSGMLRLAWRLREQRFEKGYLLTNSFSSALLFVLADIPQRIGYSAQMRDCTLTQRLKKLKGQVHQAERYHYIFQQDKDLKLKALIHITPEEQAQARAWLMEKGINGSLCIGLAVGAAYGPAKRWPAESFGRLALECHRRLGVKVLLFGSSSEEVLVEEAVEHSEGTAISLAGKTTLRELFAILQMCQVVVSNDSGLMHTAAAVGTPVVAIFGPTLLSETSPHGGDYHIISKNLECSPCMKRVCPLGHHNCMRQITVEEVLEQVSRCLRTAAVDRNLG